MQNVSVAGASRRKNVPVELIVIGAAIVLGALFANGRTPDASKAEASSGEGDPYVETAYPDAEEVTSETAPAATNPRAAGAGERRTAVAMPSGIPSDMPVLKGATLVSASADDGAGEYVLTWAVPASASAEAARTYAVLLESKGWSVTSTTDNPGSTVLVFERDAAKGGGRGWVAFVGDAPDLSATLTLSLAK
jgi:hypothetical protein